MMHWQDDGWLDGVQWLVSPNFGERPVGSKVSLIVLHNISLPPDEFGGEWVEQFFLNKLDSNAHPYFKIIADSEVSAHFYVRRDGRIIQFVSCDKRAWHAGKSCWQELQNCNDYSIGIELEGSDSQPFSSMQYESLWRVIDALLLRYPIVSMAGHSDVAPERKTDPGPYFDWVATRQRYSKLQFPSKVST